MKICPRCKAEYESGEVFCPVDGGRLITHSQMPVTTDSHGGLAGTILSDRYRVIRQIGEGGMGIVYEAVHVAIEKKVALKVLRDDFSRRPEVVERFRQEAKSASRIGHAHIVDISDFGETPSGQSYFAMEYLEGEDLANVLARDGTVEAPRAIDLAIQCCHALGAAHAKKIVHRDIKPENIFLVTRDGRRDFVKIVDFGIAKMGEIETEGAPGRKLTKTGMIFGTPEYMSPEQAKGKNLDHRVDIYALGIILYEMITGRVPFVGDTFMGILTQHMLEEPPPLSVVHPRAQYPPELESVIFKALAKEADERYQSMDALADALDAVAEGFWDGVKTDAGHGVQVKAVARPAREIGAARTQNQLGAAATLPAPATRKLWGVPLLVAVVLGVLGAVGVVAYSGGENSLADSETPRLVPTVALPTVPTRVQVPEDGTESLEAAESPEVAVPGLATVTIHVTTTPAGATLEVEGRGTVCSETPCDFETESGAPIRMTARRGNAFALSEVTPDEGMSVELSLERRRRVRRQPRAGGASKNAMGGTHGELKIPDVFR